ncbi:hypothetical protein GGF31_002878 [Allomyces arbusculus]|nr:hypothetical protein GGF31_002878 [Allomyces arbusculus]
MVKIKRVGASRRHVDGMAVLLIATIAVLFSALQVPLAAANPDAVAALDPTAGGRVPAHRRHEYRHSLRRPFNLRVPGTPPSAAGELPHYSVHGTAAVLPGDDPRALRVVPGVPLARGLVRSARALFDDSTTGSQLRAAQGWEMVAALRIDPSDATRAAAAAGHGLGDMPQAGIGAALWVTSTPVEVMTDELAHEGVAGAFAVPSPHDGLRVSLEPVPTRDHPGRVRIAAELSFQMAGQVVDLGACMRDFRDRTGAPPLIAVAYRARTLTVHTDLSGTGKQFTSCVSHDHVDLPRRGGFVAVSAQNGKTDRADIVDLYALDVYSLDPPPKTARKPDPAVNPMNPDLPMVDASSVSYIPPALDQKTVDHIHEIEAKVRALKQQLEDAATAAAASNRPAPGAAAAAPESGHKVDGASIAAEAYIVEAMIKKVEDRVTEASAEIATIKASLNDVRDHMVRRIAHMEAALRSYHAALESKLGSMAQLADTRHADNLRGHQDTVATIRVAIDDAVRAAELRAAQQASGAGTTVMVVIGLLGALGAAATGYTKWAKRDDGFKKFL